MEVGVAYWKTVLAFTLRGLQNYCLIEMWRLGILKLHWAVHIAHTAEKWSVATVLFHELQERKPLGRLGHRKVETCKIVLDK